jgi:hypothetical protein
MRTRSHFGSPFSASTSTPSTRPIALPLSSSSFAPAQARASTVSGRSAPVLACSSAIAFTF